MVTGELYVHVRMEFLGVNNLHIYVDLRERYIVHIYICGINEVWNSPEIQVERGMYDLVWVRKVRLLVNLRSKYICDIF